jgi:hypothetical protein
MNRSGGTIIGAHRRMAKDNLFDLSPSANPAGVGEKTLPEIFGRDFSQFEPPEDFLMNSLMLASGITPS